MICFESYLQGFGWINIAINELRDSLPGHFYLLRIAINT
jgi:hypothetical protein